MFGNFSVDVTDPSSQGKSGVVFGTNVVFSGGPVVFGGTIGVVVGPPGGAVVRGGTTGVVLFSNGGPVVPGTAVVAGTAVVSGFLDVVDSTNGTQTTISTSEGFSGFCGLITTCDPGIGGTISTGGDSNVSENTSSPF
jgi:hypothetical protein